ncbi:unnamed protein product [Auanema sp. JU1783]|nr:unnamed protein product [Auanema sp. JU1783]
MMGAETEDKLLNTIARTFFAEFFGTAIFVLIVSLSYTPSEHRAAIYPFLSGIALLVAQTCFFDVSGAHYNPVITVSRFVHGKLPGYAVVSYIIAQLFGSFLGAVLFRSLLSQNVFVDSYLPNTIIYYDKDQKLSRLQAFLLEAICTAILCLVRHGSDGDDEETYSDNYMATPIAWASVTAICLPLIGQANNMALIFGQSIVFYVFTSQERHLNFLYLNALSGLVALFIASTVIATQRKPRENSEILPSTSVHGESMRT